MDLLVPERYAKHGYPHEEWSRLRREAPVHLVERANDIPYWALTRHADIVRVSRQPALFQSSVRFKASPGHDAMASRPTLITMDPPRHGTYRRLVTSRLTPRALRRLHEDIERIAIEILDGLTKDGDSGECDFVEQIAAPLPIAVIAWLLGLPREDWDEVYRLTNQAAGASDAEYQQDGEGVEGTVLRSHREMFNYFGRISERRRSSPEADLISLLARAKVDGKRLPDADLLAYYFILVVAGNETTRNAISGGLLAFLDHPDQWQRLQRDETLLASAIEEILRWTTPVIHMARTATEDVEVGGCKIRAGDTLAMFYPSANRDEEVFERPFEFQIDRYPNRHLSFGVGEHFCVGAHLARLELQVVYRHLARRLEHAELAGTVARLESANVGGIKRLPIRYRLRTRETY